MKKQEPEIVAVAEVTYDSSGVKVMLSNGMRLMGLYSASASQSGPAMVAYELRGGILVDEVDEGEDITYN